MRSRRRPPLWAVTPSGPVRVAHILHVPDTLVQRACPFVGVVSGATSAVAQSAGETARAARFWTSVVAIWGRFKMTQMRAASARADPELQDALWAKRNAAEAEVRHTVCTPAIVQRIY